jgi:hypothetical protein
VAKPNAVDLLRLILLEPPQVAREAGGRQNPPMHQQQVPAPVMSKVLGKGSLIQHHRG